MTLLSFASTLLGCSLSLVFVSVSVLAMGIRSQLQARPTAVGHWLGTQATAGAALVWGGLRSVAAGLAVSGMESAPSSAPSLAVLVTGRIVELVLLTAVFRLLWGLLEFTGLGIMSRWKAASFLALGVDVLVGVEALVMSIVNTTTAVNSPVSNVSRPLEVSHRGITIFALVLPSVLALSYRRF
ncbi:hypothetical protein K402DRAFT_400116 [Aulographum hederae CBS 113979]|uniref:Uncharacterized protein n=1 Tax=Aulographum hederae CBS 113979 TaxID=1176131 RepID=A0A6G1HDX4_9PEZI|nr:hypothetical protein K402DRAFT_400116 [Aulographum hederae CBS 113979]